MASGEPSGSGGCLYGAGRETLQDQMGSDPDDDPGDHSAEQQDRKVEEYPEILDQGSGDEQLPCIVQNAAGHADAGGAEESGPFEQHHSGETESRTCERV